MMMISRQVILIWWDRSDRTLLIDTSGSHSRLNANSSIVVLLTVPFLFCEASCESEFALEVLFDSAAQSKAHKWLIMHFADDECMWRSCSHE